MNKIKLTVIILVLSLSACDILKEASSLYNFTKCDFRLKSADNISLAGVNVQKVQRLSELNFLDAAKITAALASNQLPLELTLNVEVRNPNNKAAVMNGMEWILFIDDIQMTSGRIDRRIEVMPNNQTAIMPVTIGCDLRKILTGKSTEAVTNFGMNLAGQGNKPTRIALKAKPSILIGSATVPYPDYITIRTEFGK